MATFITIGYGDAAGYERTAPAVRTAAHDHDAALQQRGVIMGTAGEPTQVRNHDGAGVMTTRGPFLRFALPIAGFAIIEANNIEEATALVSRTPCAVAHGVVEAWPLNAAP